MASRRNTEPTPPEAVYEAAIRMLARKARTANEVREKLLAAGADDETAESVIGRLKSQRHLDDAVLAGDEAFSLVDGKGLAPALAAYKLVERGIPETQARQAVLAAAEGRSDSELCTRALTKRLKGKSLAPEEAAKAGRALARLGYEEEIVLGALGRAGQDGDQ